MNRPLRWAVGGAVLGFALGLLITVWRSPAETALVRSLMSSAVLGLATFLAGLLNHHPGAADESGDPRHEPHT